MRIDRPSAPGEGPLGRIADPGDGEALSPGHNLLNRHLVLRERAGLVRTDDRGAAQGLDRGQLADDGPVTRHPRDADGQGYGQGRREALRDRSHRQGDRGHEHVEPRLAVEGADQEGHGGHGENDVKQHAAEVGDLAGEWGGQHLRRGDQLGNSPDLRAVARTDNDGGAGPVGHQRGRVGHVSSIRQDRVAIERFDALFHRNRLAGVNGLVDLELARAKQADIGRHLIPRSQEYYVSGNQLGRRNPLALALSHDRRLAGHRPSQRLDGLERLRLLTESDDGVDQHDPEDDARIGPLLQERRDGARGEQDVDQRLVQLEQEADDRPRALSFAKDVRPEAFLAVHHLEDVEPAFRVRLEKVEHLVFGQMVPAPAQDGLHGYFPEVTPPTARCP